MRRGTCPVCGRRAPVTDGIVGYHERDGRGCHGLGRTAKRPPEEAVSPAVGVGDTAGEAVRPLPGDARTELVGCFFMFFAAIGFAVFGGTVLFTDFESGSPAPLIAGGALFVLAGLGALVCHVSPAGRRNAARHRANEERLSSARATAAVRAEEQRLTDAQRDAERRGGEAADALRGAVRELLSGLPERGTPQEEAIAYCLSRTRFARDPRVRAEAERLARRHIAVDERILCVALSITDQGRRRTALLILTDRGAAVADQGTSYRFEPEPEDVCDAKEDPRWGWVSAGELSFFFRDNPDLRVALAARADAGAAPPASMPRPDRPETRLIRDARDAELVAVDWMRYLGFTDATATPVGADGGIDIIAERGLAQVKMEGSPTSRPVVQQLYGVSVSQARTALFFSLAGYTPQAAAWASQHDIALFQYDLQGTPKPVNPPALRLLEAVDSGEPVTPESAPAEPDDGSQSRGHGRDEDPTPEAPTAMTLERQAEAAGMRTEILRDIAHEVVTEQNAGITYLQKRFFLSRSAARRALEALEQLGLVSPPAKNGRRRVTATSLDHLTSP